MAARAVVLDADLDGQLTRRVPPALAKELTRPQSFCGYCALNVALSFILIRTSDSMAPDDHAALILANLNAIRDDLEIAQSLYSLADTFELVGFPSVSAPLVSSGSPHVHCTLPGLRFQALVEARS